MNGKRNGKGKEFKDNVLIFKGEYLNGKKWNGKQYIQNYGKDEIYEIKNGKGFLVELDRDYYEGEFLNGERNGKGKEYFNGNKIKFEGEYLNGKRNGKGKDYYFEGNLKFEGEYLNGKRNGKGIEYFNLKGKKIRYEGEYLNGKKWNGKEYDERGNKIYEFNNGTGRDIEYDNNNIYFNKIEIECEYLHWKKNGIEKIYKPEGRINEFEYINGKKKWKRERIPKW